MLWTSRRRRQRRQCAILDDLPLTRVALVDEGLRWVSLDGLLLDLDNPQSGRREPASGRLAVWDAERATELISASGRVPSRHELRTADGRQLELESVPITATSGAPLILGIARDLTSRRRAAREVEQAHAEVALGDDSFRAAFDAAPGPAAMIAGPGEAGGTFLRVNRAFATMLGTRIEDLELRPVGSVTHPDDRDLEAAVTGDDGTRVVRKRYLHSSGAPIRVEVHVHEVRDAHGITSYFVNHVVDIDAREASERAMLEISRIRRDMVSTISHELRTPLTSVQGYLEMIAGEDFGALTDDQKRMIDVAMRNASRLEEFVADLLMLARLDAAELDPVQHRWIDVVAVVRSAVDGMRSEATRRGHELTLDLPADPVGVDGDAAHLQRAIHSVVANAVKYTDEGGNIGVSVERSGHVVLVAVTDTGAGVGPDEVAMLGNRFFRGAFAVKRAIGGTGLGLAITKTILERHRGSLAVTSTPGEGSRVVLSLPVAS